MPAKYLYLSVFIAVVTLMACHHTSTPKRVEAKEVQATEKTKSKSWKDRHNQLKKKQKTKNMVQVKPKKDHDFKNVVSVPKVAPIYYEELNPKATKSVGYEDLNDDLYEDLSK